MDRYCLIGEHLPHSFSAQIHQSLGLDYSLEELSDAQAVRAFVKDNPYAGYNVTIPYKKTVIPFLDALDKSAADAGAVNTVVKRGGRNIGYNTDVQGMAAGLQSIGADLKDKKVMILGSGGTASTAYHAAKKQGAREIVIVSRTGEVNYENYSLHGDAEVLINCTPIGMYPDNDGCPVDLDVLRGVKYVFDAVYNPLTTRLVAEAKKRGIAASCGLFMLVAQAIAAENIFYGAEVFDVAVQTKKTVSYMEERQNNIVLVGMPSSGKTSVGRMVAALTGKEFVDTDALIEQETGKSVSQIFAEKGESGFRTIEKEIIKRVSRGFGQVISTGGGAVLDADNRTELRQNGIVFWIQRDIEKLSLEGRPLSRNTDSLKAMEKFRFPLYNEIKDYLADNNAEDICACARLVEEQFHAHFSHKWR
jgi:shikimate dehydrogenase